MIMDIPETVRTRLGHLKAPVQQKLLAAFRHALMANERTAFALAPPNLPKGYMSEVTRFAVEQVIRIDERDLSSFNRFADGIQEVITTALKAASLIQPLLQGTTEANDPMFG